MVSNLFVKSTLSFIFIFKFLFICKIIYIFAIVK